MRDEGTERMSWQVIVRDVDGKVLDRQRFVFRFSAERTADDLNAAGRASVQRMKPFLPDPPPSDRLYTASVQGASWWQRVLYRIGWKESATPTEEEPPK